MFIRETTTKKIYVFYCNQSQKMLQYLPQIIHCNWGISDPRVFFQIFWWEKLKRDSKLTIFLNLVGKWRYETMLLVFKSCYS